jgi:hypothetical protein
LNHTTVMSYSDRDSQTSNGTVVPEHTPYPDPFANAGPFRSYATPANLVERNRCIFRDLHYIPPAGRRDLSYRCGTGREIVAMRGRDFGLMLLTCKKIFPDRAYIGSCGFHVSRDRVGRAPPSPLASRGIERIVRIAPRPFEEFRIYGPSYAE